MKKTLLLLLSLFLFINNTYADNINIIWTIQKKYNITETSEQLKEINTLYWTNLDILILGQDEKGCFKEKNYIKCAKDNYWLMWSFIWAINLWIKETTWKWDVNSWMSSNMDNTREIINEQDMKIFQEDNLSYLKSWDYNGAINWFILSFSQHLASICNSYSKRWLEVWIEITDCKIINLDREINLIIDKEVIKKQEADFKYQKEKQVEIEKSKEKMISFFSIGLVLLIIWTIIYIIYKTFYNIHIKNRFKKLFWDLLEYKKFIENQDNLLLEDKQKIMSELSEILKDSEISLWNRLITSNDLDKLVKSKKTIEDKVSEKIVDTKSIENLNISIDSVKKLDL